LLFVMARVINLRQKSPEVLWEPKTQRG